MADVYLTSQLTTYLESIGVDVDDFVDEFEWWKSDPAFELHSVIFGRDGAYVSPQVGGQKYSLRHVHIRPVENWALALWNKVHAREGQKKSDRHLVYFACRGKYLLIHILDEPTAHEVALMRTPADKKLMEMFATIAENFDIDGEVP